MNTWTGLVTDGNVVVKILVLQVAVAVLVVFLLKKLLDRELFLCLLEKLSHLSTDQGVNTDEVIVVAAKKLSGDDEFRLRTIIKEKFPRAEVVVAEDRALRGGVLVRAGEQIFDFTLLTKSRQLFKHSGT
jgi:F0F1-type ATP synthase delta subunit